MDHGCKIQILLNITIWIIQHLEILNIYNCKQYWCSGVHFIYITITIINYYVYKYDILVFIPSIIIGLIGAFSLLFLDIKLGNTNNKYGMEYYITHGFYDVLLFINLLWCLLYLSILKKYIDNTNKILVLFGVNEFPIDYDNLTEHHSF